MVHNFVYPMHVCVHAYALFLFQFWFHQLFQHLHGNENARRHHGSDNVKSLVSLIRSQNVTDAIITTTVFKRHHLPKPQVLNDYCTISDGVYCTSNIQNESSEPYGCITAKFHANMQRPEIITSGNAYCYFNRRTNSFLM